MAVGGARAEFSNRPVARLTTGCTARRRGALATFLRRELVRRGDGQSPQAAYQRLITRCRGGREKEAPPKRIRECPCSTSCAYLWRSRVTLVTANVGRSIRLRGAQGVGWEGCLSRFTVIVAVAGGMLVSACQPIPIPFASDGTAGEQAEAYAKQLAESEKQQAASARMMERQNALIEIGEEILRRQAALVELQEEQAQRFNAVLDKWEASQR